MSTLSVEGLHTIWYVFSNNFEPRRRFKNNYFSKKYADDDLRISGSS